MAEITKPLQSQKQKPSFTPRRLTRQEIDELRRDKRETLEYAMKRFDEMGIKKPA